MSFLWSYVDALGYNSFVISTSEPNYLFNSQLNGNGGWSFAPLLLQAGVIIIQVHFMLVHALLKGLSNRPDDPIKLHQ